MQRPLAYNGPGERILLIRGAKKLLNLIEQEYSMFKCKTEDYMSHIIKKSSLVYAKKFELDPEENRK